MPNPTPAARLAAVLEILLPDEVWGVTDPQKANYRRIVQQRRNNRICFDPDSKDDLARVVAMLSPGQRERFVEDLETAFSADDSEGDSFTVWIITTPASTWLDALCAATGVKDA